VVYRSRDVDVAQGVYQEFGGGSYDRGRCCSWNHIENVSSCWGSVIMLCLLMHALVSMWGSSCVRSAPE